MEKERDNSDCRTSGSEQSSSKSQQPEHHVEKPPQVTEMVVISSDDEVEIIGVNNRTNRTEHGRGNNDKPTGCNSPTTKDTTCSVCLSEYDNKAFLDRCFHAFCYFCILQWSEIVHTCPLCKSGFSSIIHSVKSMDNYQQHFLSKQRISGPTNHQQLQSTGGRFRYRTTLVEGRRSQLQGNRRQQQEEATDAWGQRARQRHAFLSSQRNRTLMARERRRTIYSSNLWVQRIAQEGRPRQRNISPAFFRANPACSHRLIPWLTRELRVLLNDEETHVNFVLQILLSLITKIEITSDEFCKQLQPFLFGKTEHFIHEFKSFAQSPFDITAYDERAQYNWPSESRQRTRDTPTVFHSDTAGWQTPELVPGPSGLSMQELSRTDWTDDLQARETSSWSPRSSPGTSGLNASRFPGLVVPTLSGHSETAALNARSSTSVDISQLTSSPRTRIDDESVSEGERIDDLSVQTSNDHHHRHSRKHKHKHKHKDKRQKHLNEDPVIHGSHPEERSSRRAGPSRISVESSSPGRSIDIITVSSDDVFTPDALCVNREEDISESFAPSSAVRSKGKASYCGSSKSRRHKRRSLSASRSQSKFRSRHETKSRARSRSRWKHERNENRSRTRSRSYSDSRSQRRSRSRCENLKHERDEDRSRTRSRSYSDSRSQRRSRSRCKNLKHERDESRSRTRSRCDWNSRSRTRLRSRCENERDENKSRSRCRDSRSRTTPESRSRARKEHIENTQQRGPEQQYRSRSYLHSHAQKESGSRSHEVQRNHPRSEAELSSASLWREEKQVRAPSRCSSEKKDAEAPSRRSVHTKSHFRNSRSRCQSRSPRSSRSRPHANARSRERSASRSRSSHSVSETNKAALLDNEDIEEEIKDLEFRIATDKKRLLQLLIKQEKTAEVSDSERDESDQNVAQPDPQVSHL